MSIIICYDDLIVFGNETQSDESKREWHTFVPEGGLIIIRAANAVTVGNLDYYIDTVANLHNKPIEIINTTLGFVCSRGKKIIISMPQITYSTYVIIHGYGTAPNITVEAR